jgi:hypothetical protein
MERGIKLLIEFQGQWRASRKDPQASWTLECEVPAVGTSSISKNNCFGNLKERFGKN